MYDFIIIGYGNTGQSALHTLREKCPNARIALVDPLRSSNKGKKNSNNSSNNNDNNNNSTNTEYYRDTVVEFDPSTKSVKLLMDPDTSIGYKHGVLIATGARGAPPPLELFQEEALSRVLELRPTELSKNTKRPMMAPERVRKAVVVAASRGAKIAVLGSGWEALDLVLVAEKACKSVKKHKMPTICYANQGIAWNILPPYLSAELRKKLSKRGIDLQDRSFVRYVADFQQQSNNGNSNGNCQQLELHNAKTYDLLDTRRTILDLLVVAPDSFGDKGTAALPTTDVPDRMKESSDGRPWYKTWSQISKTSNAAPSTVVCFEDDGRIAVNTELSVASKIYAAGSCAKYPNSSTGHSSIAGEGSIDGPIAGRVAALNMSREYRQIALQAESCSSFAPSGSDVVDEAHSFATNSLPVWRSDITSYPAANGDRITALSSVGVQTLCE
jgi:NADH dehydrogenase FAD-containing subunit